MPGIYDDIIVAVEERFDNDHLEHWGIKGQRWGVRRFQNEDGSLTPEGRERYYGKDGVITKEGQKYERDKISDYLNKKTYTSNDRDNMEKFMKESSLGKQIREETDTAVNEVLDTNPEARDYGKKFADTYNNAQEGPNYYPGLAGVYDALTYYGDDATVYDLVRETDWYINDDGDQGEFNSADLCAHINNFDRKRLNDAFQLYDKAEDAASDIVDKKASAFRDKEGAKSILGTTVDNKTVETWALLYGNAESTGRSPDAVTLNKAKGIANQIGYLLFKDSDSMGQVYDAVTSLGLDNKKISELTDADWAQLKLLVHSDMTNDFLAHAGKVGMRWGISTTPGYKAVGELAKGVVEKVGTYANSFANKASDVGNVITNKASGLANKVKNYISKKKQTLSSIANNANAYKKAQDEKFNKVDTKPTILKENVIKENVIKEDVLKENVIKEDVLKENVITESVIKENKIKGDNTDIIDDIESEDRANSTLAAQGQEMEEARASLKPGEFMPKYGEYMFTDEKGRSKDEDEHGVFVVENGEKYYDLGNGIDYIYSDGLYFPKDGKGPSYRLEWNAVEFKYTPVELPEDDENFAIEHSGVEGQKWGIRNGPPYPLRRQQHTVVQYGHRAVNDYMKQNGNKQNNDYQRNDNRQKNNDYQRNDNQSTPANNVANMVNSLSNAVKIGSLANSVINGKDTKFTQEDLRDIAYAKGWYRIRKDRIVGADGKYVKDKNNNYVTEDVILSRLPGKGEKLENIPAAKKNADGTWDLSTIGFDYSFFDQTVKNDESLRNYSNYFGGGYDSPKKDKFEPNSSGAKMNDFLSDTADVLEMATKVSSLFK